MNVNLNDLKLILNGAAITIQIAWRKFKFRQNLYLISNLKKLKFTQNELVKVNLSQSEIFLNEFSSLCLQNNFLCDVQIVVNSKIYYCHSVVLWCYSRYFKSLFKKYEQIRRDYKFQLLVTNQCWEIIHQFIYGYEIRIPKEYLDELLYVSKELKIDALLEELELLLEHIQPNEIEDNFNENINQNCNLTSHESLGHRFSNLSTQNKKQQEVEFYKLNSKQPFQLISNYYKYFKCVIKFYTHKKLDYHKALFYLSTDFVDYSQMSPNQLYKCILMLKTYLKLKNSNLILEIIYIYLNKS